MLLAPLRTSLTNAVLTYVKLTKDLEPHGISLNRAIEEYKALSKLKERSVRLDFAIDRYCLSLQKKELSGEYLMASKEFYLGLWKALSATGLSR